MGDRRRRDRVCVAILMVVGGGGKPGGNVFIKASMYVYGRRNIIKARYGST